jgi:threonine/homoserine/homoserine lactone efflux protein
MITPAGATSILAFVSVAAVLVLTPGVGTTFLISTVIEHDRRAGYLTALGMVLGAGIHATIAAIGTTLLLHRFPQTLTWIGVVGGSFILLLGVRGLIHAARPRTAADSLVRPEGGRSFVLTGTLIALSNAPLPLFYFVVVPRYVPSGMPRLAGTAILSLIHLMMAGSWMVTLVSLLDRIASLLRRPAVQRSLQAGTGIVLVVLGAQAVIDAVRS